MASKCSATQETSMTNNLAIRDQAPEGMAVELARANGELAPARAWMLDVTFDLNKSHQASWRAIVFHTNDTRKPWTIVPVYIQVIPNSSALRLQHAQSNPDVGAGGHQSSS